MATIIKIKTWECTHCGSKRDSDPFDTVIHKNLDLGASLGVCHYCFLNKLEPKCGKKCKWSPVTNGSNITITILDEEEFDDPNLILHGENYCTKTKADELDEQLIESEINKFNKSERLKALSEDRLPKLKTKSNHGIELPERKFLSTEERLAIKAKIHSDIAKFKALEV